MSLEENTQMSSEAKHEALFQAAIADGAVARPSPVYQRAGDRRAGGSRATDIVYRFFHRILTAPNRLVHAVIPEDLNPLTQSGALANTLFVIALVTGVLLLFFYDSSVHRAYESIRAIEGLSFGGLLRSLHRYSSDACMFFVMLHAAKYFFAQRSSGVRWVAWITGILSLSMLWVEGFTGYWLVWDVRAQQIALGSAKMLDMIPVFAQPISLSFLRDADVSSILFFTVFFFHMLIPLAMAGALWLHIARLNRPFFFTGRLMTVWVLCALLIVSVLVPAFSEKPAKLSQIPGPFTIDYWYLAPLVLVDRLSGGVLWTIVLGTGIFFYSIPWWRRKAPRAYVNEKFCDGCTNCFRDCPFNAITMVPRENGGGLSTVDPDRCTGCGICTGSCPTLAISLAWASSRDERVVLDSWMEDCRRAGEPFFPAIVCAASGASSMQVDMNSGISPELPGFRVLPVPCAGWSHGRLVERMLKRGANGVLIAGCPPGECAYRHGDVLTQSRMGGTLDPELRPSQADPSLVEFIRPESLSPRVLARAAAAFRARILEGSSPEPPRQRSRFAAFAGGICVMIVLTLLYAVPSDFIYKPPYTGEPELLVAVVHSGQKIDRCRELTAEEKSSRPAHMQGVPVCERRRSPVRVRVTVDGSVLFAKAYQALGLWQDGASVAMERLVLPPGRHDVRVEIGDSPADDDYSFSDARTFEFEMGRRHVAHFERARGFTWE